MAPAHSRPLSLLPTALEVAQDLVDDVVVEDEGDDAHPCLPAGRQVAAAAGQTSGSIPYEHTVPELVRQIAGLNDLLERLVEKRDHAGEAKEGG